MRCRRAIARFGTATLFAAEHSPSTRPKRSALAVAADRPTSIAP